MERMERMERMYPEEWGEWKGNAPDGGIIQKNNPQKQGHAQDYWKMCIYILCGI